MVCECGRSVETGNKQGCRVRYCDCGKCNHCHIGGFCPNGQTWYHQKGTPGTQKMRDLLQSHGGHGFIPGCRNHS